jgi:hypothetical protein
VGLKGLMRIPIDWRQADSRKVTLNFEHLIVDRVKREPDGSQSRQRVKHSHESRGTQNQESLRLRGPAAILQSVRVERGRKRERERVSE